MERPADLPRIRRALSELDRITAEHPEMCQGIGQWDEKAVEKIIVGTPANERAAAYRRRLAEKGIKREVFFATPEARAALAQLRALFPDKTRDRILCDALLNLLTTANADRRAVPQGRAAPAVGKTTGAPAMSETAIHPKSALRAIGTALNQIVEEEPEAISTSMLVDRVLTDNPTWETGSEQLRRQAEDLLRACFDFGALRDEAAAIEARNPATMTDKEIEQAANRLREIGEIFEAAAKALKIEADLRKERQP